MNKKEFFADARANGQTEDAVIELAWAQYQKDSATGKQVKPLQVDVEGLIRSISPPIAKNGKEFRIISVGTEDILVSQTQFLSNVGYLQLGASVSVSCEKREAGVSGYDNAGTWTLHTSSGLSMQKVRLSDANAAAIAASRDKANDLRERNAANLDSADALANIIGKHLGDDTTAKAHAIGAAFAGIWK